MYNSAREFTHWLMEEIYRRGWSFREFAQRAGLSPSAVSKVVNGDVLPGWEFCFKVSRALELPPEAVFRKAGLLPPEPEEKSALREMTYLFSQLSPEDQQRFITFIRAYLRGR
ncbi:MAG: helix-turn-helix transcriptional regulator [Anaerolineae bacterium]|nr:helix-turn-helix transcriptional regulator [Anaerolineae bacterium]